VNDDEYARMYQMEDRHWYFWGKRRIILELLASHVAGRKGLVLEAGCGTGRMIGELARFGDVYAMDVFTEALQYCAGRGCANLLQGSVTQLPFKDGAFDLVTSLDVIEHVEDDQAALIELYRVLKPGGSLVVTVPAYMLLWSQHDIALHHKRRYTMAGLQVKLQRAGFTVTRISAFNFFVFPAVALLRVSRRLFGRRAEVADTNEHPPSPVNNLMYGIMSLESMLVRYLRLPFGVSMICLARKESAKTL